MDSAIGALLADELPDAVVLLTDDGRIAHWNRGAQAVFGYPLDEAEGRRFDELVVTSDRVEEHRKLMGATLARGQATGEAIRRRRDGSLLYVDVSAKLVRLPQPDRPHVLCSEKDVTMVKVLRDAQMMDARFRDLLESTPDGIVMTDATGHIVIANSQAERLFGYGEGELRGQSVEALLPERFRNAHVGHRSGYFLQPRKRAMGSGLDLAGLRKDGSEFPVEISLSPLHAEDRDFVMSAIRDISERKRFEKALQEKNDQLASANEAKDRFLASMGHELRTPLNAVIGFTGTLLTRLSGPLTPDQEKHLGTVQRSATHLLALINDLLNLAKIEAGKSDLVVEAVDCVEVLEDIAATLRPQAEAKGLDWVVVAPARPLLVSTDRRALTQILINLAANAIKFTDRGSVRLSVDEAGDAGADVVRLSVSDTGVGIAQSDQAKLFSPFSRLQKNHRNTSEGTGLGLHLTRKLAELVGGSIAFESEVGRGSTFTLVVPKG